MKHEIDFVVFGLTGCTGDYCLRKLIIINKEQKKNYKLGVAGRNKEKIKKVLDEIIHEFNYNAEIKIILADVNNKQSLIDLTVQCKVLINAVGPYQLYGKQVIESCIETGTHYVDISGECLFIEKMQLDYHEKAKEKGIVIVSSCGFNSILTDCGIDYLKNQFKDIIFDEVEGFIIIKKAEGFKNNIGTFHSLLESIPLYNEMNKNRNKLYEKIFKKKFTHEKTLKKKIYPFKMPFSDKLFLPFWPTDKSVLARSEGMMYQLDEKRKPVQFEQYFEIPSYLHYFILMLILPIILVFGYFKITKKILLKYPELFTFGTFSKNAPTKDKIEISSFCYYLCGKGTENGSRISKTLCINGPELVYNATSIFIVSSAVTILEDLANDNSKFGVLPPGFAFQNTNLIERIKKLGVKWELY